jgi:glycosyltransferase involved in cell wall biosynthesis
MDILIISALFPPEPVVSANLTNDIATALAGSNKVSVLSPRPSRPFGYKFLTESRTFNFTHYTLDSFVCPKSSLFGRFRESYSFGRKCYDFIKHNHKQIQVIYANTWPLFAQYFIVKASRKFNIPIIIHVQDIYPESLTGKLPKFLREPSQRILLGIDKYNLQNSRKILGISPTMISYLVKTRSIEQNKFELVRNWQDDDIFLNCATALEEPTEFIFMYLGNINQSAGVDILIHAFHQSKLSNAKFIIAGNGYEKQTCIEIVTELKNTSIEFCDVVPELVPKMQFLADVLLLPLRKGIAKTATPSKLTAYLFSAKPILASVDNDSDVANIINEATCGYLAEPENIQSIIAGMNYLYYKDRLQLREMGSNGKDFALANLSRKINLTKVVNIIEGVKF